MPSVKIKSHCHQKRMFSLQFNLPPSETQYQFYSRIIAYYSFLSSLNQKGLSTSQQNNNYLNTNIESTIIFNLFYDHASPFGLPLGLLPDSFKQFYISTGEFYSVFNFLTYCVYLIISWKAEVHLLEFWNFWLFLLSFFLFWDASLGDEQKKKI